jgi:hypothetical protein
MGRPTRQPPGSSVLPRKHRIRVLLAVCAHQKLPPPSSPTPASLDYKTLIPPSAQIPPPPAPRRSSIDADVLPLHSDVGEPAFLRFFSLFGSALKC